MYLIKIIYLIHHTLNQNTQYMAIKAKLVVGIEFYLVFSGFTTSFIDLYTKEFLFSF